MEKGNKKPRTLAKYWCADIASATENRTEQDGKNQKACISTGKKRKGRAMGAGHFKQKEQPLQTPWGRECLVFMGQFSSSVREGLRLPVVGSGVTGTVLADV